MKIIKIRTIPGPNVYHNLPVLIMTLDLEDRAEVSSDQIPGFKERLLEKLPGLIEHRCSVGCRGGFLQRLERGTYFAHIIEHLALEMSTPAGIEVGYGKSVYGGRDGVYDVIVRFRSEPGMKALLESAVELAIACADDLPFDVDAAVARAKELADDDRLGPSTQAIVDAATRRGIPWRRLNDQSLIELGYGKKRKLIQATITGETSYLGVEFAQDKKLTKTLLEAHAIPVPRGEVVRDAEAAVSVARALGGAVCIKPLDGNHGNGVSMNLRGREEIVAAFELARGFSRKVLVEQSFTGKDFRLLVVGGKLIAAAERIPARVVGDGKSTLQELVDAENRDPNRGDGHEKPMTKIKLDGVAHAFLERQGTPLDSIPEAGRTVLLRDTANLSKGGTAVDVTDAVHPETRAACERASRALGMDVCGIDLIVPEISLPLSEQRGGIIEVNAAPGIRMHHYPAVGKPRDAAGAILERLYPPEESGRIPIVAITGTNGKTTVTRMTAHLFSQANLRVGMTTSDGIFIDQQKIASGDTTGPISARTILSDSSVDVAVLETARGGIVRRGLGYDYSDVSIVTNIQEDHIGQDGIESVGDILRIKSLVAERVRSGGTLVVNADDPSTVSLLEKLGNKMEKKTLVYFGLSTRNPLFAAHIEAGGLGYVSADGTLWEYRDGRRSKIVDVRDVPSTMNGTAQHQVANTLAAIAAVRAEGMSFELIREGLATFLPIAHNSGRGNIYRYGQGYVVIDYGHNPEALRVTSEMGRAWKSSRVTGIISAPGDRSDEMIRASAKAAAAGFDRIIIREDIDLRGRKAGETAALLCETVRETAPNVPCETHLGEDEALHAAISTIQNREVIFFFYDDLDRIRYRLLQLGAVPVMQASDFDLIREPGSSSSALARRSPRSYREVG